MLWAFNVVYLPLATVLFWAEKIRPHETEWLESGGQLGPDSAHTLLTGIAVQVIVVSLANFGIVRQFGARDGGTWWPAGAPEFLQLAPGLVLAEFGLHRAHRLPHEWPPLSR